MDMMPAGRRCCRPIFRVRIRYQPGVWQVCYAGIKNCNTVLAGRESIHGQLCTAGRRGQLSHLIQGQAYCLRGYYYLLLESLFGEDNILNPTATDTLGRHYRYDAADQPGCFAKGPQFDKDSWAQVVSDLTQATTLLHGQVWTGNDEGRASEWSAQGLLGKAYVYMKDWADAKTTLLNVITQQRQIADAFCHVRPGLYRDHRQ